MPPSTTRLLVPGKATAGTLPITASPDNFIVIVAGGGHPTNSYWLQGYSPSVVGRVIEVPPSFEALLADAERDLGPRPA